MKRDSRILYEDLTSFETWSVLCHLLNEAIYPAVTYSEMSFELLCSCMALSTSAKRKISAQSSADFMLWAFNTMTALEAENTPENRQAVATNLLELGVERNIIHDYAHRVRTIGIVSKNPNVDVGKLRKHTAFYLDLYERFRHDVVYRYYVLTHTAAMKNSVVKEQHGMLSSPEDQKNVFMLSLMRAIDKFVPYRGTLAPYILQWFKHAEGGSSYMVYTDEAYSIPRAVRKEIHEGDSALRNRVVPYIPKNQEGNGATETIFDAIDPKAMRCMSQLPSAPLLWAMYDLPFDPLKDT